MMGERGIDLAHTTVLRWVQRYTPEFQKRWQVFGRTVRAPGGWTKLMCGVKGAWTYLYRAVDKQGRRVDFYLSRKRDVNAAKTFLRMAMKPWLHKRTVGGPDTLNRPLSRCSHQTCTRVPDTDYDADKHNLTV
jgi:transposase-like protein